MSRQLIIIFIILFLLAVLVIISGPRATLAVDSSRSPSPIHASLDLENWLRKSEEGLPHLRPELAKGIQWANAERKPTPLSIVFIHGFSASRKELSPVIEEVGRTLGANVFFTRLSGHGQDSEALGKVQAEDWLRDMEEAVQIGERLGQRVVVVGMSTGGTLATWFAHRFPGRIHSLILVSPNFGLRDGRSRFLLWPWGAQLARFAIGSHRSFKPENERQERYWTTRYPVEALLPMMALVDHVRSLDFGSIQSPVLLVYTENDEIVDPRAVERTFSKFGSATKEIVDLEGATKHGLAGDVLSPHTNERLKAHVLDFLLSHSESR